MRFFDYINEKKIDLRKDHDKKVVIKSKSDKSSGTLYIKGKTTQMWWKTDSLGRSSNKPETWEAVTEKDAKDNFKDMRERFSE